MCMVKVGGRRKPSDGSDRLIWSVFKTGLKFLSSREVKDFKSDRCERLREGRNVGSLHDWVVQKQGGSVHREVGWFVSSVSQKQKRGRKWKIIVCGRHYHIWALPYRRRRKQSVNLKRECSYAPELHVMRSEGDHYAGARPRSGSEAKKPRWCRTGGEPCELASTSFKNFLKDTLHRYKGGLSHMPVQDPPVIQVYSRVTCNALCRPSRHKLSHGWM